MAGPKGKKLDSKSKGKKLDPKADDVATSQPVPYYKQILKRNHADHEQFDAKSFPFEELIPRWKGEGFDPNFINAATGRTFGSNHHLKGEGLKKRTSFERFGFGFCLEWKDRTVDGVTFRDRCYNEFAIKSPGCCDHSKTAFKEGPNMVYYRLMQGDICNWGMLKDPEAKVPDDDGRKAWTYLDWLIHATNLAQKGRNQASKEGREDHEKILPTRLAEFEAWRRLEEKKDAQQGGAQAANARGYSLLGTCTAPPKFMSLQADSGSLPNGTRPLNNDPLLALSQLKLNESTDRSSTKIVNNRHRFGKDAFGG